MSRLAGEKAQRLLEEPTGEDMQALQTCMTRLCATHVSKLLVHYVVDAPGRGDEDERQFILP